MRRTNAYVPSLTSVEPYDGLYSSDDEDIHNNQLVASESEDEGIYPFRRNRNCDYYKVSLSCVAMCFVTDHILLF